MPSENLGASFSIDVTKLKAGLAQANRLIRESESQFRAAAAGMDDWTESSEGLTRRVKTLNDQVGIQEKKVEALTREKQRLIDEMIAEGKSHDEIERAVDAVNKQITNESKQLDRLKDALDKSEKALQDFKDAGEKTEEQLKEQEEATKELDDAMSDLKGAGAVGAKAIGAITAAVTAAIGAFLSLAESTREYREDMGKLETAFESAGKSTELATKTYKDFYSVLGEEDRSVEAVSHLAKFVDTEKDMATWTDICTGVWGTFGDSLPIEGLTEAANETAKTGQLTGVLADALNWAGISEDEFQESLDKCNDEQERAKKITDTLNGLYSDAADIYRDNNSAIIDARRATSDYTDTLAELGKKAEPITTKVKEGFNRILEAVVDLIDDSGLEDIEGVIDDAFDAFIDDVIPAIVDGIKWIVKHGNTLLAILKAIGIGFLAFKVTGLITSVVTGIQGLVKALRATETAQKKVNAAMAANVIGAIVTAVVLLVEGLKSYCDWADNAVNGWDDMSTAIDNNAKAMSRWQETMDGAQATLGDYSKMTTASGESTDDLKARMETAQSEITKIFETAYAENRQLRDDEVQSVRDFNQDYIEAQQELRDLQGAILKAQTDSLQWQLDNLDLTPTEVQGVLNSLETIRSDYIKYMDDSVAEEIAILDMRLEKGQINEWEYKYLREEALKKQQEYRDKSNEIQKGTVKDALDTMEEHFTIDMNDYNNRTHYLKSTDDISRYYAQKVKEIDEDSNKSSWTKFWEKQALYDAMVQDMKRFTYGMEITWTDYNFLTDQSIAQNTQAFFNWIGESKANGQKLTDQQKENAKDIVAAYSDLPDDLKEAGLNSLRGLAKGMEDEFPELEGAAEMDMEELIQAMNDALGNASPSKKMKTAGKNVMMGLEEGLEGRKKQTNSVASSIAGGLLATFRNMFGIKSPSKEMDKIGNYLGEGLANGLSRSTKKVVAAAQDQISAVNGVYQGSSVGLTTNGVAGENASSGLASGSKSAVVYQTNYYAKAHTRYELYKSKQQTEAAVRLALGGAK